MRFQMLLLLALLAFLGTTTGQENATASLEGLVVDSVTGQPLANTTVDLFEGGMRFTTGSIGQVTSTNIPEGRNAQRVMTGTDGVFRFANIVPGDQYRLVAIPAGSYLPFEYGQTTPKSAGKVLELISGQKLMGVRLEIIPTGTISGRVLDRDGEPLVRGAVQAMQATGPGGTGSWTIVQSVITNDRGEYRMYWLAPGSYFLSVVARGWGSSAVSQPGLFPERSEEYSPPIIERVRPDGSTFQEVGRIVYYPNTTDAARARPINLPAGAHLNVNLTAQSTTAHRISGSVVLQDGTSAPRGYLVKALPQGLLPLSLTAQTYIENGKFTLYGIASGSYLLSVTTPNGRGQTSLVVGNRDLENVRIVIGGLDGGLSTVREVHPTRDNSSPQNAVQPQPEPASIQGIVVDAVTGKPLTRARVMLGLNTPDSPIYTTLTGSNGQFRFTRLPPGAYRLNTTRERGYMPTQYGQRIPESDGLPVVLSAGQRLSNVRLPMTPFAAMSGRILGAGNQAVANAMVTLLRVRHREGTPILEHITNTSSNDLGEYRFFEIPPGRYYVRAEPPSTRRPLTGSMLFLSTTHGGPTIRETQSAFVTAPPRPEMAPVEVNYIPVYYPETNRFEAARPLDLTAGQDLKSVDIQVSSSTPKVHVSGNLINGSTGSPADVFTLQPYSTRQLGFIGPVIDHTSGAFTFTMDPGHYTLTAKTTDGSSARVLLDIEDKDIANVRLVLIPDLELPARVVLENGLENKLDARQIHIVLEAEPFDFSSQPYGNPQNSNGSFVLKNVMPNVDYRLRVDSTYSLITNNAFVRTVRLNGVDVGDTFRVDHQSAGLLEVVLGGDGGTVEGNAGAPNVTVVLVPDQRREWANTYQSRASDLSGGFKFTGVAPGKYKVFAWERVEPGAWRNAEFIRVFEERGFPITVAAGATVNANVTPIP